MNRFYNHIEQFVDTNEEVKSKRSRLTWHKCQGVKHGANHLDDEQHHTGFNYYEYDMPRFGTPS